MMRSFVLMFLLTTLTISLSFQNSMEKKETKDMDMLVSEEESTIDISKSPQNDDASLEILPSGELGTSRKGKRTKYRKTKRKFRKNKRNKFRKNKQKKSLKNKKDKSQKNKEFDSTEFDHDFLTSTSRESNESYAMLDYNYNDIIITTTRKPREVDYPDFIADLENMTSVILPDKPSNADIDPDDEDVTTSDPTESVFTAEEYFIDSTSPSPIFTTSESETEDNPDFNNITIDEAKETSFIEDINDIDIRSTLPPKVEENMSNLVNTTSKLLNESTSNNSKVVSDLKNITSREPEVSNSNSSISEATIDVNNLTISTEYRDYESTVTDYDIATVSETTTASSMYEIDLDKATSVKPLESVSNQTDNAKKVTIIGLFPRPMNFNPNRDFKKETINSLKEVIPVNGYRGSASTDADGTNVQIVTKGDTALNPLMHNILDELNPLSMKEVNKLQSGNADDYVSFLLRRANRFLPSKVNLESVDSKYAYNCTLSGLEKGIRLHGNSSVEILDGEAAVFQFSLSTNNLTVNCKWRKTILYLFSLNGSVEAEFEAASIHTKMRINFMEDDHPLLEEMRVSSILNLTKIDVDGEWILDCVGELLLRSTFNSAKGVIGSTVEQGIHRALEHILNRMTLPEFKNDMDWLTMKDILTYMESN